MAKNTLVLGFRTAEEVQTAATDYQLLGYRTTQIGSTKPVSVQRPGNVDDWPNEAGKSWFVLIATKANPTDWKAQTDE